MSMEWDARMTRGEVIAWMREVMRQTGANIVIVERSGDHYRATAFVL